MTNTIRFNPNDLESMRKIMDKYANLDYALFGKNESGETTQISINHDSISVSTLQKNGFVRTNIYYRDGNREELFDASR